MLGRPSPVDPEIASITFQRHIAELWATGRPEKLGWKLMPIDPLRIVVTMPAIRSDGATDPYNVKLGGEYYDAHPPTTAFVEPPNWEPARGGSQWLPRITNPPWFGLHAAYSYPDGSQRQLVCFTFTAEYYMVDHSPPTTTIWRQGNHTLAATLYRLHEVLRPPYYQGPSNAAGT